MQTLFVWSSLSSLVEACIEDGSSSVGFGSLRSAAVITRQRIRTKRALYFNQISYGLTTKFRKLTNQKYCLSH